MRSLFVCLGFVLLCLATGGLSGWLTADSVRTWYPTLIKPSWTPPSWVFGPVWTTLYILMGIAAFLAWNARTSRRGAAMGAFAAQLVLNALWIVLFFGLHQIALAAIEIVLLWIAIVVTTSLFFRASKPAGVLMLPYLAWVTYATTLTFGFWYLNGK